MPRPKPPKDQPDQAVWNVPTIDVATSRGESLPASAGASPLAKPRTPRVADVAAAVVAPGGGPSALSRSLGPASGEALVARGTVIAGRFLLEEVIGSGGMGTVYRARHLALGIPVAIKLLHRHVAARAQAMRRFRREARVTSRIQHANIVRVLDFGEEAGTAYIAMEYIQGVNLSDWLFARQTPPALAEVADIFVPILSAFEAAHALGVVHRDVKPENVMLANDSAGHRVVKVVDFGLAHVDAEAEAEGMTPLTQSDQIAGTPWYMSPEQCRSLLVGPLSDIYSLGCVLTALLQLDPPFRTGAAAEIMSQHMYLPVPPLRRPSGAESISALLENLRVDMLAKTPERRPQTVAVVRERFVAALDPRASALQYPGRKSGVAGDRADRAVDWPLGPGSRTATSPHDDAATLIALLRNAPARDGGVDDDCVLGLAAQSVQVAPWDAASGDLPERFAALVLDAGSDFESSCERVRELTSRDATRAVIVCLDGLTTDRMNRLIEAGAADVNRYPVRAGDLARKIGRALRKQRA